MLLNVNQSYSVVFVISGHLVLSWGADVDGDTGLWSMIT